MRIHSIFIAVSIATINNKTSIKCHSLLIPHPIQTQPRTNNNNNPTPVTPKRTSISPTTTTALSAASPPPNSSSSSSSISSSILTNSTLIYFPLPGRGEATRLALTIGQIPFHDRRVPFRSWGGGVKADAPWGTLPILELSDGTTRLAQSRSILRFVGRYTGLYPAETGDGDDDGGSFLRAQRIDELMDALEDLGAVVTAVGAGLPKEELKIARLNACVEEDGAIYKMLERIDGFIGHYGTNAATGFFAVGDSLSIADLMTFTSMGRLVGGVYFGVPSTVCDSFGNIQAVRRMVARDGRVEGWYDERRKAGGLSPAESVLSGCRDL